MQFIPKCMWLNRFLFLNFLSSCNVSWSVQVMLMLCRTILAMVQPQSNVHGPWNLQSVAVFRFQILQFLHLRCKLFNLHPSSILSLVSDSIYPYHTDHYILECMQCNHCLTFLVMSNDVLVMMKRECTSVSIVTSDYVNWCCSTW